MTFPRDQWVLILVFSVVLFGLSNLCLAEENTSDESTSPTQRIFKFNYGATVSSQSPGSKLKVWFPLPPNNRFQVTELKEMRIPGVLHVNVGHRFENRIGFFETLVPDSGKVSFSLGYEIKRSEASNDAGKLDPELRERFLSRNRLVPTAGKPTELLRDHQLNSDQIQLGSQLYEIVEQYMSYDKSKPGYGNGDVLWACSSKTGNCTDFHSLFISLARNQGLPARFEIGFPIPGDSTQGAVKGYHCWAWFFTDQQGWIPVDISEADKHPELKEYYFGRLTADRVAFSIGRDIELVPASNTGRLNYFVYPHVEVGDKAVDKANLELDFSFADITPNKKTAVSN